MAAALCPSVPSGPGFLSGVLRSLDCLSVHAAEQSFAFLSTPGGLASTLLGIAVTLMIVVLGFRLTFNLPVVFSDVTVMAIKVGIGLAIATSWPTVSRALAGPVINGPAELTQWTGLAGQLPERMGRADEGIAALTSWGTGRNDLRVQRTASGDYAANEVATVALTDSLALGGGRVAFLVGAIGALGLLKLFAGVMIGLAPLFAGLLLFERTQGVFAGWLRALFGLLIAGAAANILLAVELAILEPWLAQAIADRQANLATPSAPTELLAMGIAFSLITMASIFLIFRTVLALELPVSRIANQLVERLQQSVGLPGQRTVASSGRTASLTLVADRSDRTVEALQRIDHYRQTSRTAGDGLNIGAVTTGETSGAFRHRASASNPRVPRRTLVGQKRDQRR